MQPESRHPTIDLIYEQGPVYVLNKPAGVLTQAPAGIDSIEARFKDFLRAREQKTGNVYLGILHRLDRPVSGALLLTRHARAARRLAAQFENRTIEKTYWAIVQGRVEPGEGTWIDFMRKVPDEPRAELVAADHPEARRAALHYRTLGALDEGGNWVEADAIRVATWLEISLETGRMHQIRLQAAARGHALWGDEQYGSAIAFGPQHEDPRERAIALHARRLVFQHPMTHEPIAVQAPLPDYWPKCE